MPFFIDHAVTFSIVCSSINHRKAKRGTSVNALFPVRNGQRSVFELKAGNEQERGARASFAELYDRHFDAVNRYLRYRMDNPWDADDLTAAVFLKAMENFPKYRGDA
ncbi:MAG: hypothetical protein K6U04_14395, partial [Armatimonadetes bacterium]|nr:hypothetical protein [Armatimonadota bacterium]